MKQYGRNKATEFSRKQIGVVYRSAKNGDLKVEKWVMNKFYDLADYYGYDDNRSVERNEEIILKVLDGIFSGDFEETQKWIDIFTKNFSLYSRKEQSKMSREFVA